ncbi:ABC transporter ATP-binding protein [Celeribacter indicus]|uniref:Aliphatic sulfonates transporter ATP-binding protein SsuB n=1 Tax=Celeribacter indicus TaxID=1208324 RepID=A0A0B5E040_9RHOB|nr:ABC transporter ATP-binding protein [Celeribacter indicus]AJE46750.1 aliphatic sulfonates transporter ATP-binding protein SsuB [Celeribacter indicus]SDX05537.1 NitT/TauT family transport system ATP-binding protein [Celeribacter indicus]
MNAGDVRLGGIVQTFGEDEERVTALSDVDLTVEAGEFVSLVGPSGCGKSTLLRLVSGLIRPSAGRVMLGETQVSAPTPDVGFVFQAPTLLPWATVLENVLFPLRMLGEIAPDSADRARELLALVGLQDFEGRHPDELSGGMQQRVAICRGLIRDPAVMLMDEPFAALDALTREEMGGHLLELWRQKPKTIIFVTHSINEAVFLSDRVIVMSARPGRIVDDVRIGLARPRTQDMETTNEYHHAVQRIRQHIYGKRDTRIPAREATA